MRVIVCRKGENATVEDIENTEEALKKIVGDRYKVKYTPCADETVFVMSDNKGIDIEERNRIVYSLDYASLDVICGTFIICDSEDYKAKLKSLTDKQIDTLMTLFGYPSNFETEARNKFLLFR